MKKFLTVLFCTYLFLFNDIIGVNIFAKKIDEKVVVKYELDTKNEEHETKEINDYTTIENSTADKYIEEVNNIDEDFTDDEYDEEVYSVDETYSENYGTYGRLYISWYDVALYDYNVYIESSFSLQELVDNYDSAAYYMNNGRLIIADHNYQGFSVLNDLSEGSTSYIKFEDGSTIGYRLIKKEKGYNTGPDLIDTAGNSFFEMDSNLIMYTCYDDGIMVTLWTLA